MLGLLVPGVGMGGGGAAVTVNGPICFTQATVFQPGATHATVYYPGATEASVFNPGGKEATVT